ncbi:unnamed protein product [Linum trigynum]|uniref:PHD-type domain-containing protein n=1 Tax=Linum trigynum TaxID=586398 RepID=A0AAV2CS46_9ROSI
MVISPNKLHESTGQSNEEDSTQQQRPSILTNLSGITAPMLVYEKRKLSQPSTIANASEITAPVHVYKRRKLRQPSSSTNVSEITAPMHVYKRRKLPQLSDNTNVSAPIHVCKRRKLWQPSTSTNVSEITAPMLCYKRRKLLQGSPMANVSKITDPTLVYKRRKITQPSSMLVYNRRKVKRGKNSFRSTLSHSVNDSCSCSPSISNVDFNSAWLSKEGEDDTAESSSSSASGRDICLSILVRHGVIKEVLPCRASGPRIGIGGMGCRRCRVCSRSDSTNRMLLCDDCEAAFHLSCINPRISVVPVDEWFCHSCLTKKKPKVWKEAAECAYIIDGVKGSLRSVSASGPSPIDLMLSDDEPYASHARIGKRFQAEVPDWSGPVL